MDSEKNYRDPPPNRQESSVEDWQAKVDRLQELVCMLLMKNQIMRTALLTEIRKEENEGNVQISLTPSRSPANYRYDHPFTSCSVHPTAVADFY